MQVASLELCKTLHELSGWTVTPGHIDIAYSLGYLLRKLPERTYLLKHDNVQYMAVYEPELNVIRGGDIRYYADIPEDATAKLCIKLFKQGILTKESKP